MGESIDEPFPDSWVATTGPLALGMLTDIFCSFVLKFSLEESIMIWPLTVGNIQKWVNGSPYGVDDQEDFVPCEAITRIGSAELAHLTENLFMIFHHLNVEYVRNLLGLLCESLANALSKNVDLERKLLLAASVDIEHFQNSLQVNDHPSLESNPVTITERNVVETAYGSGKIITFRIDQHPDGNIKMALIKLESGSNLYCVMTPGMEKIFEEEINDDSMSTSFMEACTIKSKIDILKKYISPLRVRCISVYCLQQSLFALLDLFAVHCSKNDVSLLLNALETSRTIACEGSKSQVLSTYFQDAYLMETGGRMEEVQAAFSSDSGAGHAGRYEMYFLTQESSANNVLVRFLSLLYCPRNDSKSNTWDTMHFAEPLLVARMIDVLEKFIVSERSVGHKIDLNVWRTASDSGGKFAVHCTSFATIVVNILYTMVNFSDEQFERLKGKLFPILCSLISTQSEEIRKQVSHVFLTKVGKLLKI